MGSTSSPPAAPPGVLLGDQRPRLFCRPPGEVSYETGREVVELAAQAGLVLDDWQAWWLTETLAERPDGRYASFENSLTAPRQNGKGSPVEARELGGLFLLGEELLIHTAHQFKTGLDAFRRILARIEANPDFDRRVARVSRSHGEEGIELLPKWGRARLLYFARSEHAGRGFSADVLIYDEDQDLQSSDVGATLPSLRARPNPQVYYTGTAGTRRSTQLARIRRRLLAGGDGSLCAAEWSIDPHTATCPPSCTSHDDPGSPRAVARANPCLGVTRANGTGLSMETVERERAALAPEEFARECLGVGDYPSADDAWDVIPERLWSARMTDSQQRPARPCFAIDARPGQEATAIALAGGLGGDLVKLELPDHRAGMGWAVGRAIELDARHGPTGWVVDKRAAAGALIGDLERAGLTVIVPDATQVGHACGGFYDAVIGDRLRHSGERAVATALAGAQKRALGAQWAWDRTATSVDLCPLVAFTLAHWGYLRSAADADYDAAASVGFDTAEVVRLYHMGVYGPPDIARLYRSGLLDAAALTGLERAGVPVPAGLS